MQNILGPCAPLSYVPACPFWLGWNPAITTALASAESAKCQAAIWLSLMQGVEVSELSGWKALLRSIAFPAGMGLPERWTSHI